MADDSENDDQWLYGDNPDIQHPDSDQEDEIKDNEPTESELDDKISNGEQEPAKDDDSPEKENEDTENDKQNGDGSEKDDYDEDSDDDVNVVIGDIKTSPAYTSLNIKRGGLLTTTSKGDKPSQSQSGKFSVEEFDQPGSINGVPAAEFNLDSLEDKPWRKPGADITDYFNYGFNEDTWRAYCERQKRMRVNESGAGLVPLNAIGMPRGPVPILNDNSKYSGNYTGLRKAGPPPGRRLTGSIDVIGGQGARMNAVGKIEPPKENVIQVMTADRREYSRKPGFPDMSVPPPPTSFEEFQPEYGFNPEPEPFYGGYEPTQDSQWDPTWAPQDIKALTPGPVPPPLGPNAIPLMVPPIAPPSSMPIPTPPPPKEDSPSVSDVREAGHSERSRDRGDRDRSRDRERSHRRDRSRSRSRRHKSRSRSPSHRSHRKKKSRRHEESD